MPVPGSHFGDCCFQWDVMIPSVSTSRILLVFMLFIHIHTPADLVLYIDVTFLGPSLFSTKI